MWRVFKKHDFILLKLVADFAQQDSPVSLARVKTHLENRPACFDMLLTRPIRGNATGLLLCPTQNDKSHSPMEVAMQPPSEVQRSRSEALTGPEVCTIQATMSRFRNPERLQNAAYDLTCTCWIVYERPSAAQKNQSTSSAACALGTPYPNNLFKRARNDLRSLLRTCLSSKPG
jgi:hypothetical protein